MPTTTSSLRARTLAFLAAASLAVAARAADLFLPIDVDTYLDSQNPSTNFGASATAKVLVNNNVASDGSACRALFRFPPEIAQYSADKLARVQVAFFVFKDQTAGRSIRLFPLTRPFAEGTGNADGASWLASDGATPWSTPGGDFDPAHSVAGTPVSAGYFRWDVTDLLAHPAARSNLLANGALLQIEESPIPTNGTPRAPFTSSDGPAAERPFVQATVAAPLSFPIDVDAFLDSRPANANLNYGSAITVKTLVNSSDASVCRGLFRLPPEIALYAPSEIASAKVFFYVWQDNTAERNVSLHPLLRPFAEGSRDGSATPDGATWNTADGTNAWSTPGGDFDPAHSVPAVKEPILDESAHDRFFSWDLAPLLADESARSNLLANGALLRIDESPLPPSGTPRAPFTSSDDFSYAPAYRPRLDLRVVLRTPAAPRLSVAGNVASLDLADCTPHVAHRIERTRDLAQPNGWIPVAAWTPSDSGTPWTETLPPGWTNAYYRVVAAP